MPQLRLHCPKCGFNSLSATQLLAKRNRRVICPQCGERFSLHDGLVARRLPWRQRLKKLLAWLLLPLGYLALLVALAMMTILSLLLLPLSLVIIFFYPEAAKRAGDFAPGELVLFSFWAPLSLILFVFPLFFLYHLAWSFQSQLWLPPLSVLAGLNPNQLALLHIVMAVVSLLLLLLSLARMVPGKLAQLRELQLLVPSKARSATMGLVELEGVLRIVPPASLEGKPRWYLEDDSGRIPLDPQRKAALFNDSLYQLSEGLADGDYVYLLGHVHPNPAAPSGTLDSERLVVRPVRAALFPDPLWRQLFRRQQALRENPGVFVLVPGGEQRAQRLLRRQLVGNAALCLATIAAAVWMLNVESPRLHGYAGWTAAEVRAAREAQLLEMIAAGDVAAQQAAPIFFARWDDFGKKDPQRPEWTTPTLQLLRHPDLATRQLALRAAGTLHRAGEVILPELLGLTQAPQGATRAAAAIALGNLQVQPQATVAALIPLLQQDADPEVRTAACIALAAFDAADHLTSPCLRERLAAAGGEGKQELAQALALVTGDAERIVPVLAGLLRDADAGVHKAAAQGLGAHGAAAAAALPAVFVALQVERDEAVRYPLLLACGAIGPAAAPVVPLLLAELRALHGQHHTRRDTIFSVLRHIGPGAIAALPYLLALLEDPAIPESEVRVALIILDTFAAQGQAAVPLAQRLAASAREEETRQSAQWFLTRSAAAAGRAESR